MVRRWTTLTAVLSICAAGASALSGCAPRTGLRPAAPGEVRRLPLADDGGTEGLVSAVRRSRDWYLGLPPGRTFRYGEERYGPAEMAASMDLFLDVFTNLEGEERAAALREKFLFLESRNESGRAFFTGYYEPVIEGRLQPSEDFPVPLFAVPGDLVTVDLDPYVSRGLLPEGLANRTLRGRLEGRRLVPYEERDEIVYRGALAGRAAPLAYVADHIELFFLQIQGSGLVRLGDGSLLRLNYAEQNGLPYRAIGRLLFDDIPREEMSLQSLKAYLRAHPERVREILAYNPSYTFFRVVDEGPLGLLGVPLTPGRSVAADARLLPRGGLVYFETNYPAAAAAGAPLRRFGVVQDTGGAIRGHGRADIFWGSGEPAEAIAGPMKEAGRLFLLVARKKYL